MTKRLADRLFELAKVGIQLNEALFIGTPGWVLKPLTHMCGLPEERPGAVGLLGRVYGVSSSTCYNVRVIRALHQQDGP